MCSRVQAAKHMREESKMNKQELMDCVELISKCVSVESSEEKKLTILSNLKPTSFAYIMNELYNYLECSTDPFK